MLELEFEFPEFEGDNSAAQDFAIRMFMHDVQGFIQKSMERHVPIDSGRTFRAIDEGRVNKTPYGYSVSVGVSPILDTKKGEPEYYPFFPHEGTGIFGPGGIAGGGTSADGFAPTHGNVMAFEKPTGETVFTRNVIGQEPNPWSDIVDFETNVYIRGRKQQLAILLSKLE